MTTQEEALAALVRHLDAHLVPYMVVGGIANMVWGEPRATLDIDVTVWVDDPNLAQAIQAFKSAFHVLVHDPESFVSQTRVLPVETSHGVRVDVIFGQLPFEEEAIRRARDIAMAGTTVRVCSAEDLVLMKIISDRERDLGDARGVVRRRIDELDRAYLEPRIRELAQLLERDDILQRWRDWTSSGHV
jgi:predicted nucleotidyltransferase